MCVECGSPEEVEGFVLQRQGAVARQVELLQSGRERVRQRDLVQLVAAQIYKLWTNHVNEISKITNVQLEETTAKVYLTFISGKLRISGKTVTWLECAISVCSLLQLDTVDGIVFSLLPLRFNSSSCSSLLSLLRTHRNNAYVGTYETPTLTPG